MKLGDVIIIKVKASNGYDFPKKGEISDQEKLLRTISQVKQEMRVVQIS